MPDNLNHELRNYERQEARLDRADHQRDTAARGFSPNNLQAAVDRYEQNMRDRGPRFERSDVLAQERSLAPDVVQKLAEYRGLREALSAAELSGKSWDAEQALRVWGSDNGVDGGRHISYIKQQARALAYDGVSHDRMQHFAEHAQPGRTYTGPIVEANDKTVLQQTTDGKFIEHDRKALVGTPGVFDKSADVEIRYPHGKIGIAREAGREQERSHGREKDGPSMAMER